MILLQRRSVLAALAMAATVEAFSPSFTGTSFTPGRRLTTIATTSGLALSSSRAPMQMINAPVLNGKMLLPLQVMAVGLKGHKIAAVYAVKGTSYKRGKGEGWEHCEFVGVTRDLDESLKSHVSLQEKAKVGHVRALSFAYPQKGAMEDVASSWRALAEEAGATVAEAGVDGWNDGWGEDEERKDLVDTGYYDDEDDDDDDEDDEDTLMMMMPKARATSPPVEATTPSPPVAVVAPATDAVISPFSSDSGVVASGADTLTFNKKNVDQVLEEVRPYLISDGGNVSVQSIDEETQNVYLVLEGACGSCPSSTVTMQMGIERVLRENFPNLGEVLQVEDPETAENEPKELEWRAVEAELARISPAITAMGGVVSIVSVDPIGVVELKYQGANKLKQGIELAVMDVAFVNHVAFVM